MFVRRRNRLRDKTLYESNYWYFVTVCVSGRAEVFDICLNGEFENGLICENDLEIQFKGDGDAVVAATTEITKICVGSFYNLMEIYDNILLDQWVIMPNHIHFIIIFNGQPKSKINHQSANLGDIIKSFKLYFQKQIVAATTASPSPTTTASPLIKKYFTTKQFNYNKFWQKSFFDHIIRDENDLERIQEYIINNPANWKSDTLNPNYKKNDI